MNQEQIGPYLVKEEIVPAGLGHLFLVTDPQQEALFALRQLPAGYLNDPAFRARFVQEMQALAECGHPGIVPTRIIEIDGQEWLVRQWLPGGSLAEWLARGPLSPELVISIIAQSAAALDAAHACGVVHQNLKPTNVIFNRNGAACLADFGLMQTASSSGLNALSWLHGAPGSLSPEAALGKADLDARSDVYSLGALAFEMLTGQPPFPAHKMLEAALQHLNAPPPDLAALRPGLPSGLVQTINRALAKDPAQRFESAGEFANALTWAFQNPKKTADWVKTMPAVTLMSANPPRRQTGCLLAGVFFALLAVVAVLYLTGVINRLLPGMGLPVFTLPIQIAQASPTTMSTDSPLSATDIPIPTNTPPQPSATHTLPASPQPPTVTFTPAPSSTPMPTNTPTPTPIVIGGADLLAFVNDDEIWTVNLDGSNLIQLTDDQQPKIDLQWTPDGKALTYSSDGCYYFLIHATLQLEKIGCFDDLEISPDMRRFIIGGTVTLPNENKSWMNFLGPLDYSYLSKLTSIPQRSTSDGTAFIGGRLNQFSPFSDLMAAVFKSPQDGRQVDVIQVFRLTDAGEIDVRDSFPSRRFDLSGYSALKDQPVLDDFGWNGEELFTLHGNVLHGYGDLVLYNMDTGQADTLNPISGKCCYQDIQFSPDGQYLLFAFQDSEIGQGAQIYLIALGMIGSGSTFTPIELPFYFFSDSRARVEPALRPGF